MTGAPAVVARRSAGGRRTGGSLLLAAAAVGLAGPAIALGLGEQAIPLGALTAGGLGVLGLLALAIARLDAAVTLGFALLAVGQFAIDPSDAVFAVVIAVALTTRQVSLQRVPRGLVLIVGAFLALNLLAAVGIEDLGPSAVFLAITFYVAALAVWLASYLNSVERARRVVRGYLTGAVVTAGLGLVALVAPFSGSELLVFQGERVRGLFDDPNVFAPFLVLGALIVLEDMLSPRLLRLARPGKLALFLLLSLGVLFSYSRAAWFNLALALVVLLAVLGLRRGGARKALAVLTVLCVTAVGVLGALAVTHSFDFLRERAQLQGYDSGRFAAQQLGIEQALQYPLGIGPGQFDVVSPVSAHSTYVRALAEEGALGLLIIAALFAATLVLAASNAVNGRDTYGIGSATLLAAWCGLAVNGFFIDTLHFRFLWIIAALIWIGAMRGRRA